MAAAAPTLGASLATAGISSAIGIIGSIGGALLAAHTARLKAAQSENAAVATIIAPYDADIRNIVNAYNSGQATAAQCVAALQQMDQNIVAYLKSGVKASGTAWSDATGSQGKCDKTCTAGCCVYYGDLGPPLSLLQIAMGGGGNSLWQQNDPRFSEQPGGYVITVPQVFASKYGGTNRPSYTLQVLKKATSPLNPSQYAQSDAPSTVALGRVSNGTVSGQTPTFSATSQAQLANANFLASVPSLASGTSFTSAIDSSASPSSGIGNILLIGAAIVTIFVGIAAIHGR